MEIEVVRQINSRWTDGRTFAAMPGRRHTVDDDDTDAVAHMRHLIAIGDAVEVAARRTKKETPPETADKIEKPAKTSAVKAASTE